VSARHAQRFVSIHDPIANLFHFSRNQLTAADYRAARVQAFEDWTEITSARLAA
jgi:putative transposase